MQLLYSFPMYSLQGCEYCHDCNRYIMTVDDNETLMKSINAISTDAIISDLII